MNANLKAKKIRWIMTWLEIMAFKCGMFPVPPLSHFQEVILDETEDLVFPLVVEEGWGWKAPSDEQIERMYERASIYFAETGDAQDVIG